MESCYIALCYLRSRPIMLMSLLGVFLGIASIVVVDAVMNGFLGLQKQMVRGTHADIAVRVPKDLRKDAAKVDGLVQAIESTAGVKHSARRVQTVAMFRKWNGVDYSHLRGIGNFHFLDMVGIDAADEKQVTHFERFILEARNLPCARPEDPFWFDEWDPYWQERVPAEYFNVPLYPILIGDYLVEVMGLKHGDVLVTSTWSETRNEQGGYFAKTRQFVVAGSFRSQDLEVDYTRAFVKRETLLDWGLPTVARELMVAVDPGLDENEVCAELRTRLTGLSVPALFVETWAERKAMLLRAVENERIVMNIVLFFVVIVAAFNLLVTLNMMVSEKVRDIGTLRAMGASGTTIARLFLSCGMVVTSVGLACGLAGGLLLVRYINPIHDQITEWTGLRLFNREFYVFDSIPTELDYGRILWLLIGALAATTLITVFPSLRASRLAPVEALRRG